MMCVKCNDSLKIIGIKMLDRTQKNDQLTQAFAFLSTTITNKSKQNMFDDHRVLETVLPYLLNEIYGYNLIDLNTVKINHPAIDLGDTSSRTAVQISSDGSKDKMVKTIETLERHGLNSLYNHIIFLIISNFPTQSFQRKDYIISILNLGDIAKAITNLTPEKFDRIYEYCEKNFSSYFSNSVINMFKQTNIPSVDPDERIINFMKLNGFISPYDDIPEEDVRKALILAKERLSSLTEEQRWFIAAIMDWSIQTTQITLDSTMGCIAPYGAMHARINKDNEDHFNKIRDSLIAIDLISNEEFGTWRYSDPHYWLSMKFDDIVFDFDILTGIAKFLKQDYDRNKLEKIIVKCEFSLIN